MMWDLVLAKAGNLARTDLALAAIYGDAFRLMGSGQSRVPLLEWALIGDDASGELWLSHTVQFDQFVKTMPELVASELALRALFHQDLPINLAGLQTFARYQGGENLVDAPLATPGRDNYLGRAIRFRLTPLQRQYQVVTP